MQDANQQAFDRVRSSFESLLDQMFSRTRSWGDVMKSILMATLLTPLKQFASAYAAALLTGQRAVMGPGGQATVTSTNPASGGLLGLLGLGAIGGAGGIGGGGGFGGVPIFGAGSITGGPGGTGGFAGPVGGSGGGIGNFGGFAAQGKGILGNLRGLGNIGFGPKGGDFGGEVAGSYRGVGGATGGLMLAGGGALAFDGLRRGGFVGLGETIAGGALIGAKFGGPVGAAIGAGIGAIAGTIRLFFKGAADKVIDKVKAAYGVTLDKERGQQIAAIAKQGFGGDIDLAIRSPQVKDLIELYSMSTGQKWRNDAGMVRSVSLGQSGGELFQAASYRNGEALGALGGSIPSISMGGSPNITVVVQNQIPGEAVGDYMSGRVVETIADNPRVVQSATLAASRASSGRRESAALQLSPGLLTA
jgi:hypothetical protein